MITEKGKAQKVGKIPIGWSFLPFSFMVNATLNFHRMDLHHWERWHPGSHQQQAKSSVLSFSSPSNLKTESSSFDAHGLTWLVIETILPVNKIAAKSAEFINHYRLITVFIKIKFAWRDHDKTWVKSILIYLNHTTVNHHVE